MPAKPTPTAPVRDMESLQRAAGRKDVSVWLLRREIALGRLPAYRLSDKPGSAIRVKCSDVDALFQPVIPVEVYAHRAGGR